MNNRTQEARQALDAMNKSHTEQAAIYRACGHTLGKLTHHEAPTKRLVRALEKSMPDMVFHWETYKSEFLDPMIHVWGGPIKYDNRLSIYLHNMDNGETVNPIQYGQNHCIRMAEAYDGYIVANDALDVESLANIEAEVSALMAEAEDLTGGGTINTNYDARRAFRSLWPERR